MLTDWLMSKAKASRTNWRKCGLSAGITALVWGSWCLGWYEKTHINAACLLSLQPTFITLLSLPFTQAWFVFFSIVQFSKWYDKFFCSHTQSVFYCLYKIYFNTLLENSNWKSVMQMTNICHCFSYSSVSTLFESFQCPIFLLYCIFAL